MAASLYLSTGAAGFIGRHPVKHLAEQDIRVRAMMCMPELTTLLEGLAEKVVGCILAYRRCDLVGEDRNK